MDNAAAFFTVEGSNPLAPGAPAINAEIGVKITRTAKGELLGEYLANEDTP